MTLSKDKKYLLAGTISIPAKIMMWEISSRTCLFRQNIPVCNYIMGLKLAYDNRHIICIGLTQEYVAVLLLIDIHQHKILGISEFSFTSPAKFRDMEFYPGSINKFITCGVQHMSQWKLSGGTLTFHSFKIENPMETEEFKQAK